MLVRTLIACGTGFAAFRSAVYISSDATSAVMTPFRAGGDSHRDSQFVVCIRHAHRSTRAILNRLDQLVLLLSEMRHAAMTIEDNEEQRTFYGVHFTDKSADASLIVNV